MKVLCVNHLLYYINKGIFDAMLDYGYDLCVIPLGAYGKEQQATVLREVLTYFRPHYIFTPGWSVGIFDVDQFLEIVKEFKVPHVYWATEDPIFTEDISMVFVPHSNYVFTPAEECNEIYHPLGIASSTLMFGFHPRFFYSQVPKPEYQHDIALVANNFYWFSEEKNFRRKALEDLVVPLINEGYDIKIWGLNWTNPQYGFSIDPKFYGGCFVPYEETASIYSSAKIVLGIHSVNTSVTQTSIRTYEILASGAFYLTCHTPAHENLFQNHKHLVWSKSAEETLDLVKYYLKHEDERRAIARQGKAEVYRKHTYYHRIKELEEKLHPYLEGC
ncbi:CgeB family protein [Thermotalea metallivorans]|uniref:Spore protein YkvP n=1 Tax=Thermotalea metallivorans TaxID=520762 RepID=A0A140L2C0_9FIRM|nr:glycosyltransferase [Thermotalea metallivorans]KXG74695.1 Spore protein YkvP [Thermotalea metallivorans]